MSDRSPSVAFRWEMSSDWPLLSGSSVRVECLSAETNASSADARLAVAELVGASLAVAVREREPDLTMALLVAAPTSFAASSASARQRAIKAGLSGALGPTLAKGPDIEFELGGEGPQIRLAGAVYLGWEDWGWAVSLMLSAPGVGVAVPAGCSDDQLESLARAAFAERGGAAATARASRLQAVLSGPEPRCSGALVVAGAFDDPVFAVEYHQVVPEGRAPQWAK